MKIVSEKFCFFNVIYVTELDDLRRQDSGVYHTDWASIYILTFYLISLLCLRSDDFKLLNSGREIFQSNDPVGEYIQQSVQNSTNVKKTRLITSEMAERIETRIALKHVLCHILW